MTVARFPFRFEAPFRIAGLPLGIRDDTTGVEVSDDELRVRFGPWLVRTPLSNVVSATVTGPYRWPKVIGPPHLSLADRGPTCATNADRGVCMHVASAVAGIDPLGLIRHPAVTVTVKDVAGLAELLDRTCHDEDRVHADVEHPTVDTLMEVVHDDLMALSAAELRRRAKARGVAGASRRSKSELVELLDASDATTDD